MRKLLITICLLFVCSVAHATDYTQDAGCVGAWLFAEGSGTTVDNAEGTSTYDGAFKASGNPGWSADVPSFAVSGTAAGSVNFANGDYINVGTLGDAAVTENGAFTFVGWLKPSVGYGQSYPRIFDRGGINLEFEASSGKLYFEVPGSTGLNRFSSTSFGTGTWKFVTITWDGSTTASNIKIYINTAEVSYQSSRDGVTLTNNSAASLYLGNRISDTARTYNGLYSECAIFNKVLSSAEIAEIYNYGLVGTTTTRRLIF